MEKNPNDVALDKTAKRVLITIVLIILATLYFFIFCFRTVDAGQVGIITRYGEVNRVEKSGVAIKLPWPIEKLTKMDIRVQKEEQESKAASSDLQDATATIALNYRIKNETALDVYKTLGKDYKTNVVIPAVQESFKAAASKYTVRELITKRPEVKSEALAVIKTRLEKYGIEVVDVNITNFALSQQYNDAIEAVQVAQQEVEKSKQQLEQTKIEAEKKITQAKADAEAQRLQQETLTPELLQKYAIDKWNGILPTTNAGGSTIFSIPLK